MRSTSTLSKLCMVAALFAAFALGAVAQPSYRFALSKVYQEQYGNLVFKCDEAMRQHFLAKARASDAPSDETATLLAESEIALLDCHDYDRLRKRLIRLGLTDADLAAMGLLAIEEHGQDIRKIVEIHEIRY